MPLRWIAKPAPTVTPPPEAPQIVLAAPGSVTPRSRLTQALAAGSLLAVAFRPLPKAAPSAFAVSREQPAGAGTPRPSARPNASLLVTNNLDTGPGSLRQAIASANTSPGPDVITFDPSVSGTITLSSTLVITDGVEIQGGPGALAISGNNANRVFYVRALPASPFTTTISGLTIEDGVITSKVNSGGGAILDRNASLILDHVAIISNTAPDGRGGGVDFESVVTDTAELTIRASLISGNHADEGGGVATYETGGSVLLQDVQVLSNTAQFTAGGLFFYNSYSDVTVEDSTVKNNSGHYAGGGIKFYKSYSGTNIVRRTTITGNTAEVGAGVMFYKSTTPALIENTTIAGNHAASLGGGVYLDQSSLVTIRNSTIVSNSAGTAGGGIGIDTLATTLPVTDTIIAGNTASNTVAAGPDLTGTFELRSDLVQITGTAHIIDVGGNLFGLDPLLNPLANNGGPTQTRLPQPNSPVINAGDPAFAEPPNTDQRGDPRVAGGRIDIGAVETQQQEELFLPLLRR